MSPEVVAGFVFFWIGILVSPIALLKALAVRTFDGAFLWLIGGVTLGCFMILFAMELSYSPPWSGVVSTIVAYAICACVVAVTVMVALKPAERKQ